MKNTTDFEDILIETYGRKGTKKRDEYEAKSLAFRLSVILSVAKNAHTAKS